MGQRAQAAVGCLTMLGGAGAGLAVWTQRAQGRINRFEQGPDLTVLFVELPLALIAGTAAGLGAWAVVHGLGRRWRRAPRTSE
ncbi:hypothetical protein ACIQAC_10550 [Streptomyces sp. NPDC088387]|uniref:hypothetical protein n=1 Tax=Streptomyces sp. NPDC088387 TaxID=3365859 RepID=UPI00380A8DB4